MLGNTSHLCYMIEVSTVPCLGYLSQEAVTSTVYIALSAFPVVDTVQVSKEHLPPTLGTENGPAPFNSH